MPLVTISLRKGKSVAHKRAIADAVHAALQEYMNVPARDRFQMIHEFDADHLIFDHNYLDIERSDDTVFIQVILSVGRATEVKQAFYAGLAKKLQENPGLRAQDISIHLVENTREDWSFGNGVAQYVVLPKEQWK